MGTAASAAGLTLPAGIDPARLIPVQPLLWFIATNGTPNPVADLSNMGDIMAIMDADLTLNYVLVGGDNKPMYRLREGIERFLITDINNPASSAQAQSEVAIMWDAIATEAAAFNHIPGGSNVLYMDGHVEFIRYPSEQMPVDIGFALVGTVAATFL